ncbi:efflux RND transporter periplasmic adaptor subunit [Alteromonas sp. PRIM-21]|uniref:efflux RND transporter periplasmic adaptor subunit n=1 Tax=Alteromonas sp. PRIM-21 TaxID=1454978 RepID=UPI0022B97F91|nr:efflux RND transporter periplasmic adaptor subunit [Alteromonas sp. PRIM-21]MCZ8528988.1 efflux RND transporter periplasmic adaptor subunit [Alteromonas sp. PRIM-21]
MTTSSNSNTQTKSAVFNSPLAKGLLIGLLVGGLFAFGLARLLPSSASISAALDNKDSAVSDEEKPLYWVAPMDDSYRRDEPGKSPMGMDLVPVYASDTKTSMQADARTPGMVMIPPNVQHNMGVKVASVSIGSLQQTVTAVGNVAYDEDSIVHIHPRVSGWVDRLFIKSQGEQVEKGQALYTLYSPELVSAQEEYVLALKRGASRLISGAAERLKTLGMSQRTIDDLKKSRQVAQTVTFNAPQSGVVEALNIREGFYVQPGTTLMSIAQLDTVWVIAEVPEKYARIIAPHDRAVVTLDEMTHASAANWESHVEYIYPSLSEVTRTLKVRIPLANENHTLKPNMFTQVSLKPVQRKPALLVPRSAVIRTSKGAKVVLSDGNGNFKSVRVKLGQSDSTHFEVIKGLLPEDNVVVSAQFLIDSESSKSSDFERMEAPDHQATTTGTIESIELPVKSKASESENNAEVVIARGPIEKWNRGPATMSFAVSKHIDVSKFKEGDDIVFTFVTGDPFTVIDMRKDMSHKVGEDMMQGSAHSHHEQKGSEHLLHEPQNQAPKNHDNDRKVHKSVNHKSIKHEAMDHKSMEHKSMEHKSISQKEHMHHD